MFSLPRATYGFWISDINESSTPTNFILDPDLLVDVTVPTVEVDIDLEQVGADIAI